MYESAKVAELIKKAAKSKGLQLKIMLTDLQLNKNTLSNMYNGSMLKGDSLARIADYLDCSVDYLLGRTDDPQKEKSPISEALSEEEQIHALSIQLYELMIKLGVVSPGQDLTPGQIQVLYQFGRDFIRNANSGEK